MIPALVVIQARGMFQVTIPVTTLVTNPVMIPGTTQVMTLVMIPVMTLAMILKETITRGTAMTRMGMMRTIPAAEDSMA